MRYTLLELTQSILRSMESDEVSDVAETQESKDVVDILKECYFDIIGWNNLQDHVGPFSLDPSGDNLKPTLMTIPSNVARIDSLKYNIGTLASPEYLNLRFVDNEEFIFYQNPLAVSDTEIGSMQVSVNSDDLLFKFYNDRFPSYYTIFDEYSVVFDAYDSTEESTLTEARSLGMGLVTPVFTVSNTFVPDLDPRQFQLLLQDAKATAFQELKQTTNPKAEAKYRRNMILAQKTRNDNDAKTSKQRRINFGRNRP